MSAEHTTRDTRDELVAALRALVGLHDGLSGDQPWGARFDAARNRVRIAEAALAAEPTYLRVPVTVVGHVVHGGWHEIAVETGDDPGIPIGAGQQTEPVVGAVLLVRVSP